jgi:integrase
MAKPVTFKYLYEDRDRHGNCRLYVRMRGAGKIRLRQNAGTTEFMDEYQNAVATLTARRDGTAKEPDANQPAPPNSLSWLIERYYASGEFKQLDPRTRQVRRLILDKIRAKPKSKHPFRLMRPRNVTDWRDEKAEFPEAANGLLKSLRQVFRWAMLPHVALATENPAAQVPYLKGRPDGFHSWTLEEVEQFEAFHAVGTKARLTLALLLYTGVRRSDVVQLGRQHMRDGWITFRVTKGALRNPKTLSIPVLPTLKSVMDATPSEHMTFLVTEFGKSYTAAGFGNWFRRQCNAAGLPHCSAHGLRKAGAALAAEAGASESQLKEMYGWSSMKEAEHYTRKARQKVLAGQGMPLIEQGRKANRSDPPEAPEKSSGSMGSEK